MSLPIVDYTAKDAPQRFVKSLKETGFAILVNHPIQQSLVSSIYHNWQSFFNAQEKYNFVFDKEKQDGYFSPLVSETAKSHTKKDIKEFYHIYPWGRIPETLEEEILNYYQVASALASELLDWVEEHSPQQVADNYSEALSAMIKDTPNTLLRVLHYPPLIGDEETGAIRAAAHEDINLLTILPAANEAGLQVRSQEGHWLDVPSDFDNLIVNIGDMLQEASDGYFPSTTHRVINPVGDANRRSRISLPLFLHPRSEVKLSEKHTQASYLSERLSELGIK